MSRLILPFAAPDISALARSLRAQLAGRTTPPGHLELLNMLARAAGSRNYQHFRATASPSRDHGAEPMSDPPEPVDHERVTRALRYFDAQGRLARWPARTAIQRLCLWPLWADFPSGETLGEAAVNLILKARNGFSDHAILRRELCNNGLLSRTPDGRDYHRIEQRPPADARALIRRREDMRSTQAI